MTREPRSFRAEPYEDYLAFERGLSDRTIQAYRRDLNRLLEYLGDRGVVRPEEITSEHLRSFVFHLKDSGLAPSSIRRAQSSLRSYFGFLLVEGVLEADPSERMESPQPGRRLPTVLSMDEIGHLLEAPDPDHVHYWRDRAILEVLYATGIRVSELVGLKLVDLDLTEGFCTVLGKGRKERIVPLGKPARRAVSRYLRDLRPRLEEGEGKGRVFLNHRGRPLSRMSIWKLVSSAAEAAGIEKTVSPHTLRHTFATHLLEGGADLVAVQELLGHADISTTQVYTHLDREYLRNVHRDHHPRSLSE